MVCSDGDMIGSPFHTATKAKKIKQRKVPSDGMDTEIPIAPKTGISEMVSSDGARKPKVKHTGIAKGSSGRKKTTDKDTKRHPAEGKNTKRMNTSNERERRGTVELEIAVELEFPEYCE